MDAAVKAAKMEATPPPLPASPHAAAVSRPPSVAEEMPASVANAVPAGKASEMADAVIRPPHATPARIAKRRNDWPLMIVLGAVVLGMAAWVLFLRDAGGNVEADPAAKQSLPLQEHVAQDAIVDAAVSDAAASAQLQRGTAAYDSGDFATALEEMRPLAEQGNATAQNVLGFMYQNGKGVPQDDTQAVNWYRRSADQGDASGQNNLGFMYEGGRGVSQDYTQAAIWYRRAADQGNTAAQSNLGWMYRNGKGVQQDDIQAVNWYRKAADQGNPIAQNNLGWMYHNGKGIPQDDEQAKYWLGKAADQGHADAKKLLDEIESGTDAAESSIWQAADTGSPAITPSFDCTKASSANEKLICSDQDLAAADLDVNLAYRRAMAGTQDPELLKTQAKAAWKWREDYCHDKQCLLRWFASRKAQLQEGAISDAAAEPVAAPGAMAARLMQQCIANSRSLTTPAGSKVALSESEAAQYCNCARQKNGTLAGGIPATVGNHCLNQL